LDYIQTLRKKELICGLIFLPIYIFVLPLAVGLVSYDLLGLFGIYPTEAKVTLLYYFVSLIIVLIIMGTYLKESFFTFIRRLGGSIYTVFVGYFVYAALLYAVSLLVSSLVTQQSPNPNNEAVLDLLRQNSKAMTLSSVILAPIVEESLFRGVIFAPLLKKNRLLAYALSFLIFAFYHLWQYMIDGISTDFFVYLLQYLPGSIVLCWTYERSGTIWSPILLHSLINGAAVSAIRSFG